MTLRRVLLFILLLAFLPLKTYAASITLEEERKYGRQMYSQIASSIPINNDPYISIYLRTVKDRLEEVAKPPFSIVFTIIDSPTIDAFASIGGYVYMTTGLVAMCDTEAEFAGVLSHEYAHIAKRHIAKTLEKQKYVNWTTLATLLAAALVPGAQAKGAALMTGLGAAQQMSINYTRENEEEADRVGAFNADKAGYGGLGTAEFLKKLRMTAGEKTIPQYLLTHPYHDERIIRIENDWRGSQVTADTSFFPYIAVRAQILHGSAGAGIEEIWVNKYLKNRDNPVHAYAAALVFSSKGNFNEAIRITNGIDSRYTNMFRGEILVNAAKYNDAIKALKDESNPIARLYLARAYPDIYNKLGKQLGMMGNHGAGYEYLGRYYMEIGKEDLARTNFEKAINKYGINTKEGKALLKTLEELFPKKRKNSQKDT